MVGGVPVHFWFQFGLGRQKKKRKKACIFNVISPPPPREPVVTPYKNLILKTDCVCIAFELSYSIWSLRVHLLFPVYTLFQYISFPGSLVYGAQMIIVWCMCVLFRNLLQTMVSSSNLGLIASLQVGPRILRELHF